MNCRRHSANRSCVASPYPFSRIAARSRSSRRGHCVDVGASLHSNTGFDVITLLSLNVHPYTYRKGWSRKKLMLCRNISAFCGPKAEANLHTYKFGGGGLPKVLSQLLLPVLRERFPDR